MRITRPAVRSAVLSAVVAAGFCLATCVLATGAHAGDVEADGATPPKIFAKSWVVADADTGDVLASRNAHKQLKPASTLKTLTAVTLLPRLDKSDTYKVEWEDAAVEGSAVGIVPGATYTINELFYGLLLPSGNDAAHALANAAGGMDATVELMRDEAERLGAEDTRIRNPSGLDTPLQVSSAFDLALFAREGLTRSDFRRYVGTVSTSFPAEMPKKDKKRKSYMIYNQNPLLIDGYRGILGVKTGYTTEAGRTFVAAAERGGRTIIVSLMGIVEPTDAAASKLLNWSFDKGDDLVAVDSLDATKSGHDIRSSTPSPATTVAAGPPGTSGRSSWWITVTLVALTGAAAIWAVSRRRPRRAALPPL
jgi:D-alanyl-D-alanine carboxypeptidase (penicillin-binding protein 5/6)